MTHADLEALARRCESEEPSWQLDIAIGEAVFGVKYGTAGAPRFSSSLDAAVSLVPSEHKDHWGVAQAGPDCVAHVGNQENEGPAKTPALALCAAALRARAAMEAA